MKARMSLVSRFVRWTFHTSHLRINTEGLLLADCVKSRTSAYEHSGSQRLLAAD